MSITALTVVYNTPDLLIDCVGLFKKFYPDIPVLIMNNSDPNHECTDVAKEMEQRYSNVTVVHYGKNHGHGWAVNDGMKRIKTDYVYYFDSDIKMNKGGALEGMMELMDDDTYGIGKIMYTSMTGKNIRPNFEGERLRFLYAVVGLINKNMYFKFHHWTKFGLPAWKAMVDIHKNGNPDTALKNFPIMSYVKHFSGGTRSRFGDCEDIVEGFKGKKSDMTSDIE